MARGRPQVPHRPSFGGDPIVGLYHCPDGRWRINATGEKFTEKDERRAINRFRQWEAEHKGRKPLFTIPAAEAPSGDTAKITAALAKATGRDEVEYAPVVDHDGSVWPIKPRGAGPIYVTIENDKLVFSREADEAAFWLKCRHVLVHETDRAAKAMGLPELNRIMRMQIPQDAIRIDALIDAYRKQNPSTDKAKARCISIFNKLVTHAQAKTLDDLTQPKMLSFRHMIEDDKDIKSAGTKIWMYGQIKAMLSFGLKCGMDQQQIRAALDRCKVLWTADAPPAMQPKPISRDDFHKLLKAAGAGPWRAWLLMGLNAALYLEELCALKWDDIDLDRGVYTTIRNKTKRERVPRAAVLWPETIEALKALHKGPTYVFTSTHGTRFASSNARANAFADLRTRAQVSKDVGFASLKDAAYTIACQQGTDERMARVLAGHRSPGLQDAYVLRHPEMVRPACDAIYAAFGPFPGTAADPAN